MIAVVVVTAAWLVVALTVSVALRTSNRTAVAVRLTGGSGHDRSDGRVDRADLPSVVTSLPQLVAALIGRRAAGRATRQELIVLVDELTSALASGASPYQAMVAAARLPGPVAADLAHGAIQVGNGRSTQAVFDEWGATHASVGATLVADALALADVTGGSRTRALVGVRATLREADGLAAEVRTMAAQSRLSAAVLTLVPLGFAALVAVADPRIASFLLATPLGWACLAGGGTLDAIGAWWMHRLTGRLR